MDTKTQQPCQGCYCNTWPDTDGMCLPYINLSELMISQLTKGLWQGYCYCKGEIKVLQNIMHDVQNSKSDKEKKKREG